MVSNFSVWLCETARLYLRYMAVGLIGIPLAFLYASARRADWNATIMTVGLLLLGFASAFFLWRRLGDWQVKAADAPSDAWADLINATIQSAVPHQQIVVSLQQSAGADDEKLRAWNHVFASAVASTSDVQLLEAALNNLLAQQMTATEWEQYKQALTRRELSFATQVNVGLERTRQRQPAWALALGGQTQNAHGLA